MGINLFKTNIELFDFYPQNRFDSCNLKMGIIIIAVIEKANTSTLSMFAFTTNLTKGMLLNMKTVNIHSCLSSYNSNKLCNSFSKYFSFRSPDDFKCSSAAAW